MSHKEAEHYDLILVGSGFASCFFLIGFLKRARKDARVLILERGAHVSHAEQLQKRNDSVNFVQSTLVNKSSSKTWQFSLLVGGGSNCWWGCTPRFLPEDFRVFSTYGVGEDWPISYEELEPYYCETEKIMNVAGESNSELFPRSQPYPQPSHLMADPDKLLREHYWSFIVPGASARARRATAKRPKCCASGVCGLCPIDSKFTVLNELSYLFDDPRVTLKNNAKVETVIHQAGVAQGVEYRYNNETNRVNCDLLVLGANGIFNPSLLTTSGLTHGGVGRGLHEQTSLRVICDLAGVKNFNGSSQVSANGYQLYSGKHRRERAACLIETSNVPHLRTDQGRWTERLVVKFIFEDLRQSINYVKTDGQGSKPEAVFLSHSEHTKRSVDYVRRNIEGILRPLPIEKVISISQEKSEGHIIGTAIMGNDPATSVVDRNLRHHKVNNLLVLGSSSFPMSSPSNPTLTLSALSLWAADRL